MSYRHRVYPHRYKVLSGPNAGLVSDGQQIGVQDYPEQIVLESFTSQEIARLGKDKYDKGLGEGIWLKEIRQPMYRSAIHSKTEITEEGVNYDNTYMDLCVPFDRYGNEIKVGDTLFIASKNEVRRAEVIAISKKPYMASYGIVNRKLTVRDEVEDQTLTTNDPRSTVRA